MVAFFPFFPLPLAFTFALRQVMHCVSLTHWLPSRANPSAHLHPIRQSRVHNKLGFTSQRCSKQLLLLHAVHTSFFPQSCFVWLKLVFLAVMLTVALTAPLAAATAPVVSFFCGGQADALTHARSSRANPSAQRQPTLQSREQILVCGTPHFASQQVLLQQEVHISLTEQFWGGGGKLFVRFATEAFGRSFGNPFKAVC